MIKRNREIEASIQILSESLMEKVFLNLDSKYLCKAFTSQHWNIVYSKNTPFFKSQYYAPKKQKVFITQNVISNYYYGRVIYLSFYWHFQL